MENPTVGDCGFRRDGVHRSDYGTRRLRCRDTRVLHKRPKEDRTGISIQREMDLLGRCRRDGPFKVFGISDRVLVVEVLRVITK